MDRSELLHIAIDAAIEAGKAIMDVYLDDYEVNYKEDNSPLTIADKNAHKIIAEHLANTGIPLMSEEGKSIPFEVRKQWKTLWIVDPLDGTKEFIKRNGEFTVNIALVENHKPVLGVVFCPTLNTIYYADRMHGGAFMALLPATWQNEKIDVEAIQALSEKLPITSNRNSFVVVASRSHLTDETKTFIEKIKGQVADVEFMSKGSSLKLCMIAEGRADIYPRFAPTSEWDTAAGQAVVELANGRVIIPDSNSPVIYNKENILNPWFIAVNNDIFKRLAL